MYAPNDLDFWHRNPKFNRGHLLVMTNPRTKLEDPWATSSLVIDQTRFVYGPTDLPTDGWTCAKQYTPTSLKGDIIMRLGWAITLDSLVLFFYFPNFYCIKYLFAEKANNLPLQERKKYAENVSMKMVSLLTSTTKFT